MIASECEDCHKQIIGKPYLRRDDLLCEECFVEWLELVAEQLRPDMRYDPNLPDWIEAESTGN